MHLYLFLLISARRTIGLQKVLEAPVGEEVVDEQVLAVGVAVPPEADDVPVPEPADEPHVAVERLAPAGGGNCSALRRLTATTMPSSSTALYVLPDTPLPSTSADALRRLSSRSSSPPSKQTSPLLF